MSLSDKFDSLFERQVMAIVNVTDDSFYESSRTLSDSAIRGRVEQVIAEGASIIDIGGYSSRPGAVDVSVEKEWERVERGLRVVRTVSDDVMVSVDTFRSEVARRALAEYGELIINDISAGELDPSMADVVARYDVPYVAMHMRGTPLVMQQMTDYKDDITSEVYRYFEQHVAYLHSRGVRNIIIDPGFGFAKNLAQNYELLAGLKNLSNLGCPVLVGLSRKSMIYKLLGAEPSDPATLAATSILNYQALLAGVSILRVHDVREAVGVINMMGPRL